MAYYMEYCATHPTIHLCSRYIYACMLFYNIIVQHICVCMLFYKSRAFFMSARAQLFTQQSEFCLLGFHLICNSASCDVTHIPTASDAAHTHICSSTYSVCVLLFFGGPLQLFCREVTPPKNY